MAAADYDTEQRAKERAKEKRREERKARRQAKRDRNVHSEYQRDARPLHLDFPFRLTQFYYDKGHKRQRKRTISSLVESFTWTEEKNWMTGTISLRHPDNVRGEEAKFEDGDVVRCEVFVGGRWDEIWEMRLYVPDEDIVSGTATFQIREDLALADSGSYDWEFVKKKKGPHKEGWKAHDIARHVCHTANIRVGKLAKARYFIPDFNKRDTSPLGAIIAAYAEERKQYGTRFIFRWEKGRLSVYRLKRSKYLYQLRDKIIGARLTHDRGEKFATAVTMVGSLEKDDPDDDKKGKTKDSVEVLVEDKEAINQYGYLHMRKQSKRSFKSKAEMKDAGLEIISNMLARKTLDTISITHVGIPYIRRGDAVEIRLPKYGFTRKKRRPIEIFEGGTRDILYVTSTNHSVAPGNYTMDLEFGLADPVAEMRSDIREARDERRREEKRKERDKDNNDGN